MNPNHQEQGHKPYTAELATVYTWEPFGPPPTVYKHPRSFDHWALIDTTGRVRSKISRDDTGLWTVNKRGRITIRRRTQDDGNTLALLRGAQYLTIEAAKRAVEAAELARVDQLRATAQTEAVQ